MKPGLSRSERISSVGYAMLDITTRSWIGFWLTWMVWIGYVVWNILSPHPFDPWPFVLLMGIVTLVSYQQNVVIMTVQRKADRIQQKFDETQRKQLDFIAHSMEAQRDTLALLMALSSADGSNSRLGVEGVEPSTKN